MQTQRSRHRDRGFSFIELLAYMAIAALLILAAIPQFNQYRAKAVISNMRDTAHNAAIAAEAANIGTVAAHKGTGSIRLAAARVKLAAASSNFDAIKSAVETVKINAGESLGITDEGSGDYLIAVTSSKAAATTKVVYASTYATTDGIAVPPGTSTIVDGNVVGQEPSAGGSTPPTTTDPSTPVGLLCPSYINSKQVYVAVNSTAVPNSFPWGHGDRGATEVVNATNTVMYDKNGGVIDNTTIFKAVSTGNSMGLLYNYQDRFSDAQQAAFRDGGYITSTVDGETNKLYFNCSQNDNGDLYQSNAPTDDDDNFTPGIIPAAPNGDLTATGGKYSGNLFGTGNSTNLVWTTGNAKTFSASNVHVYLNADDYASGREISGAATGSWTLNAQQVGGGNYKVTASGDLSGLNATQRAAWGNGLVIKFVDGSKYEVVSVTTPPASPGDDWDGPQ